jgi:hypothetical protein
MTAALGIAFDMVSTIMWVFLAHMACERADGSLRLWGVACLALIAAMGALETVRHIEHAWPTLLRGDWTI